MLIVFDEGREVTGVGKIASSLTGDGQFDSYPTHLLEEEDSSSPFGRPSCGHQTRGPSPNDNHIPIQIFTTEGTEFTQERKLRTDS